MFKGWDKLLALLGIGEVDVEDFSAEILTYTVEEHVHGISNQHSARIPVQPTPDFRPASPCPFIDGFLLRDCVGIPPSFCISMHLSRIPHFPILEVRPIQVVMPTQVTNRTEDMTFVPSGA